MKSVRLIAGVLFYITRVTSILYLASALHVAITTIFKTSALDITEGGNIFYVLFPFTSKPFLVGEYNTFYMVEMVVLLGLYGLFFWLLGNVLKAFRLDRLFTAANVKRLTWFYLANLLVPLPFLVLHIYLHYEVGTLAIMTVLHFVLGVFTYFMTAIFRQGFHLQNEQDLYI
ncbi:DUF2975 domain-containing protein [Flavihumibacter stibioxidans]|uniref:DUF2975 domain-containing protein n=1 Tax=Flavihumibacter stibioxidans TaxID=1834163 RepID=A0ABR7M8H2_9BACT|nr:DUF2975 domain-containing protein [Flavihumibacter stibioxidans]MBC6491329.1 hypothetical protein [Flavihumibacter stibioxidans]